MQKTVSVPFSICDFANDCCCESIEFGQNFEAETTLPIYESKLSTVVYWTAHPGMTYRLHKLGHGKFTRLNVSPNWRPSWASSIKAKSADGSFPLYDGWIWMAFARPITLEFEIDGVTKIEVDVSILWMRPAWNVLLRHRHSGSPVRLPTFGAVITTAALASDSALRPLRLAPTAFVAKASLLQLQTQVSCEENAISIASSSSSYPPRGLCLRVGFGWNSNSHHFNYHTSSTVAIASTQVP